MHKFTPEDLHHYQRRATLHQLYHDYSMLWLGMSLGKTVITLSTIEHRMRAGQIKKVLIWGPVRVIHSVWEREARKWSHTKHLRFSIIHGTEEERIRALFTGADIYLCNYENMAWLSNVLSHYYLDQGLFLPFDMCVYDEISRVKDSTSKRISGSTRKSPERVRMLKGAKGAAYDDFIKVGWTRDQMVEHEMCKIYPELEIKFVGWRRMIPYFRYRTGLTGTPAPNGYGDLHGQYLCVDGGIRLFQYITRFRESFMQPDRMGWKYTPTDMGRAMIEQRISDITLSMKTEDYLELPPVINNLIEVELPPAVREKYDEVEKELFTRLDDGTEIELFSQSSVSNKCLQFANGSPYISPETQDWVALHEEKFLALDSIIEEAAGQPVAVSYSFVSDAERMVKRYKHLKPVFINDVTPAKTPQLIRDWCAGNIRLLIGHPASMGHGLDGLQDYGDILVWFGLTWNYEYYLQMLTRFMRQGRTIPLTVHTILAKNTADYAVKYALEFKATDEGNLKRAIDKYRAERNMVI